MTGAEEAVRRRLALATEAARDAGDRTLHAFRSRSFNVVAKDDGTPVTDADRDAELALRRAIEATFPGDAILGEEFGESDGTTGYRWLIDPIDGTRSFIHGVPLYGTLVGVEREGESVAGVIRMPALGESVYAGEGAGAWHEVGDAGPAPARVSQVDDLAQALLCLTSPADLLAPDRERRLRDLCAQVGAIRGWSDCYAHLLVATGRAEIALEPAISPWDVAPMTVILREAGGRYTSWAGEETAHAPNGVSTNGRLHEAVLAILAG